MSERKPGWYWVALPYHDGRNGGFSPGPWVCMEWEEGEGWWFEEQGRSIRDDGLHSIGPRIPSPDEPWVCVPVDIAPPMRRAGQHSLDHGCYIDGIYADIIAAAPKPEDT